MGQAQALLGTMKKQRNRISFIVYRAVWYKVVVESGDCFLAAAEGWKL